MTKPEMRAVEDAQIAYEGYRDHTGGISLASGQAIPEWGALRPDIQAAWCAAAHAMREVMFCPPHWHMEHTAAMEPFAQCIACTREEVRELRQRRDFLLESNNRLVEERRAVEEERDNVLRYSDLVIADKNALIVQVERLRAEVIRLQDEVDTAREEGCKDLADMRRFQGELIRLTHERARLVDVITSAVERMDRTPDEFESVDTCMNCGDGARDHIDSDGWKFDGHGDMLCRDCGAPRGLCGYPVNGLNDITETLKSALAATPSAAIGEVADGR